ncbi:MAG: hypothetical protein L6243_04180 [Candidatus Altiarchaeales archaeon]|nr:hypothetical protein [Candidatus Altiarchaeales archaeon]
MAASKPSKGRKSKRTSSLSGRKSKKSTSLGQAKAKRLGKPERKGVGMHVILMTAMFLFLALFNAYSTESTEPVVVGKVTATDTTTTTSTTTSTSTTSTSTIPATTTSTIPTTTTTLCGGEYQPPCEDGCNLGFIIGSTGNCHPKGPCAPSVSSGRDGCGSFALSFCAGARI